jgi:AcrR family transcriptional regulator
MTRCNGLNTREKILQTAIDMFSVKGYNDVSIRDITGAIGIKESSLYNHFTSKQQILDEIFGHLVERFESMNIPEEEAARLIEEASPQEFMEMCLMNFRMYFGDPKLIKIWRIISIERFRNKQANDFFIHHFIDYPFEYQAKVFESMMKKGLIAEIDPMVLAREFYSFMLMIYLRYFEVDSEAGPLKNPVDDPSIQKMIREHMQFLSLVMARK